MSDPLRLPEDARTARRTPTPGSLLAGPTAKAEAIAGSDMAAMVSEHDWSATPLGPAQDWPHSLKSAVRLMLGSRYPMFIWWGSQLVLLYNDAYVDVLGPRHPWALGRGARETWGEIWDVVGPQADTVMQRGAATWNDRVLLTMERKGYAEETYFTFSYSPCFNDEGEVGGVICTCTEETHRVLGERRLKTLGELAAAVLESRNPQEACGRAARALAGNSHDLPFVLFYLQDTAHTARLAARAGVEDPQVAVAEVSLTDPGAAWPLHAAAAAREPQHVGGIDLRAHIPAGPWPEPVQEALVLPLPSPTPGGPGGFMVAGLNPRRPLDADYRAWLALVAQQVAGAIADARAFEEEQLRARALAELDRAKTTFFSNVSHELRTPLALMLGPVGELLQDAGLDERTRRSLALAQRNGRRLQRLVSTLLDFSRIEAGRLQARFQPVDLASATAELVAFFDSAARKAGLELDIDCEPLPEPAYVDRAMWERIIFNLLSNAIKYTLVGRIRVRLRATPAGPRLEVADTGIGIPREAIGRVFERFFRVEGAQGRSIEGTGIGLALVAELVRMHGATVHVESRLGEGSVFTVQLRRGFEHLPASHVVHEAAGPMSSPEGWLDEVESWLGADLHEETAAEPADASPSGPAPLFEARPAGERGSVLLVDDNADMRSYLSRLLGREHEVRVAADGWQALQLIGERVPDLVMTDAMMARMDGFQLLQRLRESPATATLPVIMVSANAGDDARVRALEAGADDFLVKPFHARELLARVAGTLRLAQVRREAMRREQELRAEVENVLESITQGFIAVDAEWRFTYVNRAAEAIYGRSRAQLLGRELWEVFPEVASSVFQEPFRRAMRDRTPVTAEGPYNALSGWFEVNIYPVASGGLAFYFHDVLQTRLLERSIRDSESQQRFLSDFAGLMQRSQDPDQVLNEAVRAIAEHLQADRCVWALVGDDEDTTEIHGEFRREGMPSMLGRIRLTDFGGEHVRLYHAGRPFVVHDVEADDRVVADGYRPLDTASVISVGVLRGERIVAAVAVHMRQPRHWIESEVQLVQGAAQRCWEAFERAQVQRRQREDAEALAQAHAALQQVERRKDQFIATLAHELRNPLAPLRNGVELLALGGGAPDGGARVQAMMRRQIDQLVRLVDDLLEVSRITSGKVVLQRARVSLQEVLAGAAEANRPVVEAARHSLHVDLDGIAGLYVDGDALRLSQVFANLLNNAAKYTEPGGHISMAAWREGRQAVVQVQDNGMGLSRDMLEEVFQPFVQADRSASRAQGGLGIGLSIVRSLAELHGGRVRAHSGGLGRGSTFEVRLPLAEGPLPAPQAPAGTPGRTPLPQGPSVLVVDDNRDAADSLGYMLEMMGARIRVVYGGPDALEAVEVEVPALVLLDLGMPGMDGYQVVRRLANHPQRSRMHIVALTGWGQAEDRQRTREAGFDEHLVKPAELESLEALLARVGAMVTA